MYHSGTPSHSKSPVTIERFNPLLPSTDIHSLYVLIQCHTIIDCLCTLCVCVCVQGSSPPLGHPTSPEPLSWVQVVKRSKPSRSNTLPQSNRTMQTPPTKSRSLPQRLPRKQYKLMIRNTPSRNRGATDEEILKCFSRFGRIYHMDRQGSNTALIYDNMESVTRGLEESRRRKLVCSGVTLNCTR